MLRGEKNRRPFLDRPFRAGASFIVPFIVIALAFGALSWRSYQLSARMETGLNNLAVQYLSYAAEITARRVDASVRGEMFKVTEDWQQVERMNQGPTFETLRDWIVDHPWIVSAIYVPDADPTGAVYVSEETEVPQAARLEEEFYTASGSVKYSYDAARLVEVARPLIRLQQLPHFAQLPEAHDLMERSNLSLVTAGNQIGLVRSADGPVVTVPLAVPLGHYAIRTSIRTPYIGAGWGNHRVISGLFGLIALVLLFVAGFFAIRGLTREEEAMKLRSALIANISHELRTPLSMIRLAAETLQRNTRLAPADRTAMEEAILREVLHLSHLVENVLDVARLEKGAAPTVFAPLDPIELVSGVVTNYGPWIRNKGFSVELDIDSRIGEQMWDREGVSRALMNLIDNAIKYSSSDKHLTVSLRAKERFIELAVRDRGIGIRSQDLGRIFEPYYRATFSDTETRRGAGLGLTLVHQIVRAHGGQIEVDSEVGKGSVFRLLFPKAEPKQSQAVESLEPKTEVRTQAAR